MESLKNKFRLNTNDKGEILEKTIKFNYDSLVGNFKNVMVFLVSVLVSLVKLESGATPFAFAIFGAMGACEVPLLIPWVLICITTGAKFGRVALVKFVVASTVFVLAKSFIKNENTKIGNSAMVVFATAISEIVGLAIGGMLVYDALMAVYMSIITAVFYFPT